MASIAVPAGQSGTIIPLEVVPATDGSGTYVLVVSLQDANIDVGTVDVALTYNHNPPVLNDGQTTGFQSDIHGNLKVNIAASDVGLVSGSVEIDGPLPAGSNTIGAVNQGTAGSSAWKVDPSGVTSPVSLGSLPPLAAGSNKIGGVFQAPTSLASLALTPGSSSALEASHVLKSSPGNLYSLYVVTGSVGGFLMTFDATDEPPDGPVTPVECIPVAANSIAGINADGSPPDHYSAGIVAVFSTTGPFTKTTTSSYGTGPNGQGLFSAGPVVFFKWSVQ